MKITRIILFILLGGTSTVGAVVLLMLIQPIVSALIPGRSADRPSHLEPPAHVQLATQAHGGSEPEPKPELDPVVQTASEPEPEPEITPAEEPKHVAIAKPQPQTAPAPKPKPVVKAEATLPPPPPPPPIPAAPPAPVE